MRLKNHVRLEFFSRPENVSLARTCAAACAAQVDCTLDEMEEIKLVVSEAVSNCIIHGYDNRADEKIVMELNLYENENLEIIIYDYGRGIDDIDQALQPAYSSVPGHMGMGFVFMKSFMDYMNVESSPGDGTTVKLTRNLGQRSNQALA
ncbi:MAG: anti-sigma F factor [Syntrophomonadaceae bacterium]|nr:anti-sigma F factor [Syntrophomonadaceae bacterium]